MAEETNVALPDSTASGAEMEHSQQDNGAEAADIAMDEGTFEPPKEGAEQEETADGTYNSDQSHSNIRLTYYLSPSY